MKKILSVLLSAVMILSVLFGMSVTSYADSNGSLVDGNYEYVLLKSKTAKIKCYKGNESDIIIPEKLGGYTVSEIGDYAFQCNDSLVSVTIPGCIKNIGDQVFSYCSQLTSVDMLNGVRSIGCCSFLFCTQLKNVNIPSSVFTMDGFAFSFCESLENIVIPNIVTDIPDYAFEGCKSLKSINIPSKIIRIGNNAFKDCVSLEQAYCCMTEDEWSKVKIGYGNEYLLNVDIHLHSYDSGKVTKEPTCTSDGIEVSNCAICGWEGERIIHAKGHTKGDEEIIKDANCIEEGLKTCTCSVCGEKFEEVIPKTEEHSYGPGKVVKKPECSTPGLAVYTCRICGKKYNMILPALDHHTYSSGVYKVKPTCKESGIITYTCTGCGYSYNEVIEKINHNYNIEKITKQPTCCSAGEKTHTCSGCGSSYIEMLPMTDHTYNEGEITKQPTCYSTGIITYSCTQCNKSYTEVIEQKTHSYKKNIVKATFAADGEITEICTECNNIKSEEKIPKVSSVNLSKYSYTYNGKVQKPSIIVKDGAGKTLKLNTDYTVTYSDSSSKNVGKYTVTVNLKGNYSGSKTIGYCINPKGTDFLAGNKGGIKAVKNGFALKWSKQSSFVTGYKIQYATKSDFSNAAYVNVFGSNNVSKTITGRAGGKKYYVRIQTFYKANGKTFYSPWSSGKAVTTLK